MIVKAIVIVHIMVIVIIVEIIVIIIVLKIVIAIILIQVVINNNIRNSLGFYIEPGIFWYLCLKASQSGSGIAVAATRGRRIQARANMSKS